MPCPHQYAMNSISPNATQTQFNQPLISTDAIAHSRPTASLPALFISHGAPTLAVEKNATTNALARIGHNLPTPNAVIIMSAHWLTQSLEISSNPAPQTWHDFSGFEAELHHLSYAATGHPQLAESLSSQLNNIGILNHLNPIRPFDHGVWSPLMHLYPEANIPVVQLSLPRYFDAYACYQLGHLCRQLRQEQILIIGSGNITHNLSALKWNAQSEDKLAKSFKTWLQAKLKTDIPAALEWQQFKGIDHVHPTTEHLLPLFFALGTGQRVSIIHERMAHHSLGMDIYRFD